MSNRDGRALGKKRCPSLVSTAAMFVILACVVNIGINLVQLRGVDQSLTRLEKSVKNLETMVYEIEAQA
jgi:hypothetical protein